MNLLTKLRYQLAGLSLKAGSLAVVPRWVRASFLEPSFERLTRDGYKKNSAFMACVATLAFGFPEPPLRIFTEEGDQGEPLPLHPLRILLRRPNPIMSERALMSSTMVYLAIGGNAYWHKVRNGSGQVIRLWPYHAGQLEPVPGGENWISYYSYDDGSGRGQDVPTEDVVHFRWPLPDPDQPWMALPPIVAAAQEVDMDNEARRYVYALLRNDAVPRVALEVPEHVIVDDAMEKRLKSQWRQKYGGDNRGEMAILTGGAKATRVALDLEELAYEALSRVPETRIAANLRVPAMIAGLNAGLERSTFANYAEARQAFTEDTLSTLWELMAAEVDSSLVPEFGNPKLDARFDLRAVKALQENTDALWARVDRAVRGGYLMLNEGRRALGFEEVPDGDIFLWVGTTFAQDADDLAAATAEISPAAPLVPAPAATDAAERGKGVQLQDPQDDTPPKALPAPPMSKASRTARRQARRLQRIRLDLIEAMADDVDDYFADMAQRVVDRAQDSGKGKQPHTNGHGPAQVKATLPTVDELLTTGDEERLRQLMERYYIEVIRASWQSWGEMLEDETVFSLTDPAVRSALSQAGGQVRQITDTTRSALQDLLTHAYDEGWSIGQLVSGVGDTPGLRSLVTETYHNRGRTIARTELGTAQQSAAVARYNGAGVRRVQVLDNGFDNSDPVCVELNGTIQTLDWATDNLLQHPNCVRAFAPYYED